MQCTAATHYCNALLQHTTATHYCNTLLQHTTATHYCNTLSCPWCYLYCWAGEPRFRSLRSQTEHFFTTRVENRTLPIIWVFVRNRFNTFYFLCIPLRITSPIWDEGTCGSVWKINRKSSNFGTNKNATCSKEVVSSGALVFLFHLLPAHMNESCQTHERVMSHIFWMSHVTQRNESCHTSEWGMS